MKNLTIYLIGLLLLSLVGCRNETFSDTSDTKIEQISLDTLDLVALFTTYLMDTVEVAIPKDEFFRTAKQYKGISLTTLLSNHAFEKLKDTTGLLLVFECSDGYKPTMPLHVALQHEGYIVFQDKDAPNGKPWIDSVAGKFAPYYLVWKSDSTSRAVLPTPYGLYKISFSASESQFANAYPKSDHIAQQGFEIFKTHCMKCHSINKVGGNLGPELNYPKNITEYWRKEDIWNFIQHPQSYRYNSKMPAQAINKSEFDLIIAYLEHIKSNKLL